MNGSLTDCLVLDVSRLLPGPYCSMILADHGARVIAVEDRRYEKESIAYLNSIHRNKEHMTLNLKSNRGKEIFHTLLKKADVIIEGFRPGAMKRLGLDYESVRKIKPDIIYCSVTGYGQTGNLKHIAGHDVNFAGYSGVLSMIGMENGMPCIPGIQLGDMIGGLNAAIGILLALYSRSVTGKGQYIDISMTDSLIAMLPIPAGIYRTTGDLPKKGDWLLSHRYACYNVYKTKDDKFITVGALEPRFWEKLCERLNVSEFAHLQFDETRRKEITERLQKIFSDKTRDEWILIFSDTDACVGSVLDVAEMLDSDFVRERNMTVSADSSGESAETVLGIPVKLSQTPGSVRTRPARFGEHTRKILTEIGYSENSIDQMEEEGTV